jgi:hypothetical protein
VKVEALKLGHSDVLPRSAVLVSEYPPSGNVDLFKAGAALVSANLTTRRSDGC